MTNTEYNYWIDKIKQDAKEVAIELNCEYPQLSQVEIYQSWIKRHRQALNYLINQNIEVSEYTLASTYSDIISGRIVVKE